MGSYFRNYNSGNFIEKVLIKKRVGSPYPDFKDFSDKINLLKKYLGKFIIDTEIFCQNDRYCVKQSIASGVDLFVFLKKYPEKVNKQTLKQFIFCLDKLYKDTKILPDLIGYNNIIVTKTNKIKLVDVWPLFFRKRVIDGDLNESSYKENLDQFEFLRKFVS